MSTPCPGEGALPRCRDAARAPTQGPDCSCCSHSYSAVVVAVVVVAVVVVAAAAAVAGEVPSTGRLNHHGWNTVALATQNKRHEKL